MATGWRIIAQRRFRFDKHHRLDGNRAAHFLDVIGVVAADADHLVHREIEQRTLPVSMLIHTKEAWRAKPIIGADHPIASAIIPTARAK